MSARRYVAVVQDLRGYPGPDGPSEPDRLPVTVHSVVLADDYERLVDAVCELGSRWRDGSDEKAIGAALAKAEAAAGLIEQGAG